MDNNYKRINGTRCHSCDWENPVPKVGVLSFYSNRILEVEVNDGDFLCIWHHAYQRIDIGILNIGTEEDCITLAQKTSQEDYENCEDAIDCTFCNNCINQTQLIYESQLNKKQKKETILTILNNKRFSAIMKDCKPNLRYPLRTLLCTRKQVGLLFIYYRLKKLVKKFLKKKSY